jgi:hypothetical protein
MTDVKRSTGGGGSGKSRTVWSDEERAAIQEYARERRRVSRRGSVDDRAAGEAEVQAKIAAMAEPDQAMARQIHSIVLATAPDLVPRTWYGSPAYYRDGNLVCFFQERAKFKARYATLGFSDKAHIDDGTMWPNSYALTDLTAADAARIAELVKKAVS